MAFINEKLTSEQKDIFNSLNIKRPVFGFGHVIREVDMEFPWYWTIDKERKMYLMSTSYDRDYLMRKYLFLFGIIKTILCNSISALKTVIPLCGIFLNII